MKEVLLIDKDKGHQTLCKDFLAQTYTVHTTENATEGLKIVESNNIGLIISEIKIGVVDGFQLFEIIKYKYPHIKFMIYTHEHDISFEVQGIDLGINPYLHKRVPFEIFGKWTEVLLRKHSFVSRKGITDLGAGLQIDVANSKVFKDGVNIKITKKEFELLTYLVKNKNKVLKRETIAKVVWRGRDTRADNRVVDSCIKCLRSKLNIHSIQTISGVGYEWSEPS